MSEIDDTDDVEEEARKQKVKERLYKELAK
jgi:hypothetical protein